MNQIMEIENIKIEDMIYEIRGVQVMLSSDVAKLYQVEPKVLNQTIKRNINRFPESFCFQLNEAEIDELSLRSQFVTLNKSNNLRGQHFKYLPYGFIIIDKKELYHVGASLKDLGKKYFAITRIENSDWINELINNI